MISAFLRRRWWLTQNRILTAITGALIIPIILYISVVTVLNNIIVRSIDGIPYSQWVFPGLIVIIATIGLFPLLYRDFFDLRIHRHILQPVTLAPISKMKIVAGIGFTAIIESLVYVIVSLFVLSILISTDFTMLDFFSIILYVIIFNGIMANALITISLLSGRVTAFMFFALGFFLFVLFGSGILVEFEFYPALLSTIFANLPTSQIMHALRNVLFMNRIDWYATLIPVVIVVVWYGINSLLFKVKSKQ